MPLSLSCHIPEQCGPAKLASWPALHPQAPTATRRYQRRGPFTPRYFEDCQNQPCGLQRPAGLVLDPGRSSGAVILWDSAGHHRKKQSPQFQCWGGGLSAHASVLRKSCLWELLPLTMERNAQEPETQRDASFSSRFMTSAIILHPIRDFLSSSMTCR